MKFKTSTEQPKRPVIKTGDIFQMRQSFFICVEGIKKVGEGYERDGYTYVNLSYASLAFPKFETLEELNDHIFKEPFIEVFDGSKISIELEGAKK
ncbi:MAG TPA: hypothetical protein VK190_04910 [Pseudoneobacillus sp.]|nr:hypothetical protein [Pseudoneobacillus sp.]